MRPPWLFALLFASLCPFYAFGFPSVSPFWGASNLDWLNELRADYPLNSTCVEWSYFDRGRQRNAVCFSLPSNDSVSLNRCSRRSSVLTGGRCASSYAFVHTLGPRAADSLATWRSTATVRTEFSLDQYRCSAFRRARDCWPLEPLSFAAWRVSHSGRQFVVIHGDLMRGVANQWHQACSERAASPCRCGLNRRALRCEQKGAEHVSKPRSNKV
jgi:hypothetical protein